MSNRPPDILADVVVGELGVCSDADGIRPAPSLDCAWRGDFEYEVEVRLWWWFIDTFVDDAEERARIHRAASAVRTFFLDLGKLHYAVTGEPVALPEKLIRALEMRIVSGMRPSAYEVAIGATTHPTERASVQLAKLTTEEAWRTRSLK